MRSNIIPKSGRNVWVGASDVTASLIDATSPITGPGSYESHVSNSIAKEARKKFERMSRASAVEVPGQGSLGFNSRAAARELPHEHDRKQNVPGPGVYNPELSGELAAEAKQTFNTKMKAGTSGFATHVVRGTNPKDGRDLVPNDGGDPGSYNPNVMRELAAQAKKTFQSAFKGGRGAFGSTQTSMTKRTMQLDIGEDTPGPDAYNADKATASSKIAMAAMDERERMPSSSFRSAGRKGTRVPQQDQPGPGAYSPNLEAVTEALPGANMRSNIIPKSGRNIYMGGSDIASSISNATSPITGPGSYDPRTTNNGELSTLEEKVFAEADRGWGSNFSSDTTREMFTALISDDATRPLWQRQ